jgi:Ser/Thr protein kinase RdoA (MazF antagonist)
MRSTVHELLPGGRRNAVWRVTVDGRPCIARPVRRSAEAIRWELRLIEFLLHNEVHVPRLVRTTEGRWHSDGLVVLTWIDGRPPESEPEWWAVAAELERVHSLTRGWKQRPGFASTIDLLTNETGGDVDLRAMPEDAVRRCRDAWDRLRMEPMSAVHGDPRGNALITDAGVAFIDWDECRVDASVLDFADLPYAERRMQPMRLARARRGASAWEAANGWIVEPEYARRRLDELDE